MVDNLIYSLGGVKFGEFLLGEKVKTPEIKATDINTSAVLNNTISTDKNTAALLGKAYIPKPEITGGEAVGEGKRFDLESLLLGGANILGGWFGSTLAQRGGRESNLVGIGASLLGSLGYALKESGSLIGGIFGSILGGVLGGIFGRKEKREIQDTENIRKIVENTAVLKDIDSRILNAPGGFTLPALARTGGSVQYNIDISIQDSRDPNATADAIIRKINREIGSAPRNYNTVSYGI